MVDTHNYVGFYADVIPRTLGNIVYLEIFSMLLLFQVGFCSYIGACAEDYKIIMKRLPTQMHQSNKEIPSNKLNHGENVKIILNEAIDLHGEMHK